MGLAKCDTRDAGEKYLKKVLDGMPERRPFGRFKFLWDDNINTT
jgi:hypothetical protein